MENEELDLDQIEKEVTLKENISKRISGLVERTKKAESEKEELIKAKLALEQEKEKLVKEGAFSNSFADSIAKYPEAKDFKDKIREKVLIGYDVEDATISVLAKEGKLPQAKPSSAEKEIVAGGSAPTSLKGGAKSISEMTQAERRTALLEAEKRGDISV